MPVVVVATMTAKPESVDAVRDACTTAIEAVHDEPGCELYSLHEADGTFVFVEQWADDGRAQDPQHRPRHRRPVRRRSASTSTAHPTSRCCSRSSRAIPPRVSCGPDERHARKRGPDWDHSTVASRSSPARPAVRAAPIAVKLASEGADIIAVDLCDQIASVPYPMATADDLAATVKLVEDTGARIVAQQADVRDRAALKTALQGGRRGARRPARHRRSPTRASRRWPARTPGRTSSTST